MVLSKRKFLHEMKNIAQRQIIIKHLKQRVYEMENKWILDIDDFLDKALSIYEKKR